MRARRTVLVTRAAEQAAGTAARLQARGYGVVVAPLIRVERLSARIDPRAQAILVTSRNGAAALATAMPERDVPVLAVGDASAADLRAAGFSDVRSAGGDAVALERLAASVLDPAQGPVIHVRGAKIRHSPLIALQAAGFGVEEVVLYRTIAQETLPPEAAICDTALVYSPGSASRLAKAMVAQRTPLDIVAISEACLPPLHGAPFIASLTAAKQPTEDSLFAILDGL